MLGDLSLEVLRELFATGGRIVSAFGKVTLDLCVNVSNNEIIAGTASSERVIDELGGLGGRLALDFLVIAVGKPAVLADRGNK